MESERGMEIKYLLQFAVAGELRLVKSLIENKIVDVNSTGTAGRTALHEAAFGGHNEVVEYLISTGAEIDKKTQCDHPGLSGATAFSYAVMMGKVDVVKTLIEHGADTKVIVNGFNFLDFAINSDNPEIIELALSYGYDINQYGASKSTPLTRALLNYRYESVKFLLEKGADYKKDSLDNVLSPLSSAAQEDKHGRCLKLLLEHVEKKEGKEGLLEYINYNGIKWGRTALHIACMSLNYNAVKILLDYGADTSIKDEGDLTASDSIEYFGCLVPHVCVLIKLLFQRESEQRSK